MNSLTQACFLLFFLFFIGCQKMEKPKNEFNYIITEAGEPTSFDPLDADRTNNLPSARMLYLTPLEISHNDELYSTILSSFSYNPYTKTIHWEVRDGLTFEDGSPITVEDVAFSVARMVYTREKFPVIKYIKGVEAWKKKAFPLKSYPEGIKISGNNIALELTKNLAHPLFRFTLEVFSIIPKKCVNLTNNKIECDKIPSSGYYKLVGKWIFQKRNFPFNQSSHFPQTIKFSFLSKHDLMMRIENGLLEDNDVVASNEELLSQEELTGVKGMANIKNLVFSRFSSLLLNPNYKPFDKKECRQLFSNMVRDEFKNRARDLYHQEDSIFTKLVPGFLSREDLRSNDEDHSFDKGHCLKIFNGAKIDYAISSLHKDKMINQIILDVSKKLKINMNSFFVGADYNSYFCEGKSAIYIGGSGFWPLDPVGDIQMMLTPNLHRPLDHITKDPELQETLKAIDDLVGQEKVSALTKINKKLHSDSLINVYQHFGRIFITNKKINLENLPISITAPAPWQVFN